MAGVWLLVLLLCAVFMDNGLCFLAAVKQGESNAVLKKGVSPDDDDVKKVVELLDSVLKRHTPAQPVTKEVFQDKASLHERNDGQSHNVSGKGQLNDQQSHNVSGKGQLNDAVSHNVSGKGQLNDIFQEVQEGVNQNNTMSHTQQSESLQVQSVTQNNRLEYDSADGGIIVNI